MPAAAVAASLVAGAVASQIEVDPDSAFGGLLFQGDAGAARELLIVVSATMITVTGLVFTLTVVALQISSTQFSPRLLRSFLRDRGTQVVLSIFVSTFAYATAGLYTVGRLESRGEYVPRLAISGALLLALGSVGAFVWYLHHLAHSIQIDDVMRRIERTTLRVVGSRRPGSPGEPVAGLDDPPPSAAAVPAPASGYVQAVFPDQIVGASSASGLVVRYCCSVGDHVVAGSPVAWVWGDTVQSPGAAVDIATSALRLGFERTFEQDALFGVRQLTDIALRAMSPAINDPYTSVQAVQHISVVVCAVVGDRSGPEVWRDAAGVVRVQLPGPGMGDYLDLACGQLRRVAAHEPLVVVALLRMLADIGARVRSDADRAIVRRQADLLVADARRATCQPADLDAVEAAFSATSTILPSLPPAAKRS
jgi:uncharacterized membrane protein